MKLELSTYLRNLLGTELYLKMKEVAYQPKQLKLFIACGQTALHLTSDKAMKDKISLFNFRDKKYDETLYLVSIGSCLEPRNMEPIEILTQSELDKLYIYQADVNEDGNYCLLRKGWDHSGLNFGMNVFTTEPIKMEGDELILDGEYGRNFAWTGDTMMCTLSEFIATRKEN